MLNEIFVWDNQNKNEQKIKECGKSIGVTVMMAVFYQEKEICKLFKSENGGLDINFSISSNEVRHNENWDYQKGKLI